MKSAVLGANGGVCYSTITFRVPKEYELLVYTNLHTMSHCCARDGTAQGKPCDCVGFRVDIYG